MKPMFSIFTLAIKFVCLFLAIFQSFHWFVGFIFDKLASPLKFMFQKMFEINFWSIPVQKTVSSEVQKT